MSDFQDAERLPALTGIRQDHTKLKHEFLNRLIGLLERPDVKIKGYSIDDAYYSTETLKLELDDCSLVLMINQKT